MFKFKKNKTTISVGLLSILLFFSFSILIGCSNENDYSHYPDVVNIVCYTDSEQEPISYNFFLGNYWYDIKVDIPHKTGYIFQGYYDEPTGGKLYLTSKGIEDKNNYLGDLLTKVKYGVRQSQTIYLYAHWAPIKVNIKFNADSDVILKWSGNDERSFTGSVELVDWNIGIDLSSNIYCPVAIKDRYEFLGWFSKDSSFRFSESNKVLTYDGFNEELFKLSNDGVIDLFAKLERKKITVTFDFQYEGMAKQSAQISQGEAITSNDYPETPNRTDYDLVGWSLSPNELIVSTESIEEDLILYAIWRKCKTITLNFMDGSAPMIIKIYEDDTHTPFEIPHMRGCEFKGWSRNRSGSIDLSELTYSAIVNGETLYAVWNKI